MQLFIALMLATLLDPIRFVMAVAGMLCCRWRWWGVLVTAALVTAICQWIASQEPGHDGAGWAAGLIAGLVHGSLIYWFGRKVATKQPQKGGSAGR